MIALLISFLIAAYLLVPNALFRFVLGLKVPVKFFQESKTEDLTRAVVTLGFVFVMALIAVWYVPFLKEHPFQFADTPQLRSSDYRVVASALYSEQAFREYGQKFWEALSRTSSRQGRFFCWYYILVVAVAWASGWASTHYGRFRRNKLYAKFADLYLLPHISQWYVLLKPFIFADKRTVVKADVLMTDDTLYRGDVAEYFLDKDGNLSGLFLANPTRFDRRTYLQERDRWGTVRAPSAFWRQIPSAKLYLIAEKIVNLNLNYEPPTPIAETVERYVTRVQRRPISVSIGSVYTVQKRPSISASGRVTPPKAPQSS